MKMTLIYPKWPKLERQTEFHLPPHGPAVFAASVPSEVEITFFDENVEAIDFSAGTDLAAISAQHFEWREKRPVGIFASTTNGCLETDINYLETMLPHGGRLASPNLFAYVLPNIFLGEAAIRFGFTGPCYSVNEDELSGLNSLRMAFSNILLDESPAVIAGICDAGQPESFEGLEEITPEAIFFVLEQTPADKSLSYGNIEMDDKGNFLFSGKAMTHLRELLHMCLHTQTIDTAQTNLNTIL